MNASGGLSAGLVPIHIALRAPEELALGPESNPTEAGTGTVPEHAAFSEVAWSDLGAEPRWLGRESSDCVAAFNPSFFHGRGDAELERFLRGAKSRDEIALIIATIGKIDTTSLRSPLSPYDASVQFPGFHGSVAGKRLPTGAPVPKLADELSAADRDLGLRLRNRPAELPWWALRLRSFGAENAGHPGVQEMAPPPGTLQPILVDSLGEPVAAVWIPEHGRERWYTVPDGTDWNTIVDWLVQQALPVYVSNALRRVRSFHFTDPELETAAEATARQAIADLEASYAERKSQLEDDLRAARDTAGPIREGLLHSTGRQLEDAVAAVLTAAGFAVEQLDDSLGTASADLLVGLGGESRLVEVKSASGTASESLVSALQKHLSTWPKVRPSQPVAGGVLVVNHQHRLDPGQRSAQVYGRPEFIESLTVPVITSGRLFDWWRQGEWAAIQAAVLGQSAESSSESPTPKAPELRNSQSTTSEADTTSQRRRPWTRLLGGSS